MKKHLFFTVIIFTFLMLFSPSFANTPKKVVVLPVDAPTYASSYSIYPNTLSLVSADLSNSLTRDYGFDVLDLTKALRILEKAGLSKKYRTFIRLYKDKYVFDYDFLGKMSDTLNVDNIVFVSGGFDTQKLLLKQTLSGKLGLPWAYRQNPSYRLNLMITLVNADNSTKLYEETFKNDFKIENFDIPSQHFAENSVSIDEIKSYSQKISHRISYQINANIRPANYNTADFTTVKSTKGTFTKDKQNEIMNKAQKSINNVENLIDNKKRDYKNWILKQL